LATCSSDPSASGKKFCLKHHFASTYGGNSIQALIQQSASTNLVNQHRKELLAASTLQESGVKQIRSYSAISKWISIGKKFFLKHRFARTYGELQTRSYSAINFGSSCGSTSPVIRGTTNNLFSYQLRLTL
jgi:hypothetical protein